MHKRQKMTVNSIIKNLEPTRILDPGWDYPAK